MNKLEFLEKLGKRISSLPEEDIKRSLEYYGEMIDDFIEDGLSEEEAVKRLGSMDEIVSQILSETSLVKIVKQKAKPSRALRVWEIVLIVLGSPIWLSLAVAAFSVIISLYAVIWSLVISLWSVFGALVGSSFGVMVLSVAFIFNAKVPSGIAMLGAALVCAGLSILFFFVCKVATKGICVLTKKITLGVKYCFTGKEKVK